MFGITLPEYLTADPGSYTGEGFSMNLPAFLIVLLVISLLIKGTEKAASANNFIVILKVSAVIFVIIAGAFFIDVDNWSPFIPEAQTIIVDDKPHEAYGLFISLYIIIHFGFISINWND